MFHILYGDLKLMVTGESLSSGQLSVVLFPPCQAAEGWGSEPTGDWGTEESWESVDGNQGRSLSGP